MSDIRLQRIAENVARLREQIAAAAVSVGRDASEVRLVAVTKYVDLSLTQGVFAAGCQDLGESRPQRLWEKATALARENIRWHLIGALQRNKVAQTLKFQPLIHSGSSWRLLEELQKQAELQGCFADVLLEVNISGDAAKHGFAPDQMATAVEKLPTFDRVRVHGLMAMSGLDANELEVERQFATVRKLRDQLSALATPGVKLCELSLGMSSDFMAAIRQGATLVRIGSAIFDGVLP
jgi:pyridoxal phosphate enzyme (YggS family)